MNCYLGQRPALICKQGTAGSATSWQTSSHPVAFVRRSSAVHAAATGVAPTAEELLATAGAAAAAAATPSASSACSSLPRTGSHNRSSAAAAHRTRHVPARPQQQQLEVQQQSLDSTKQSLVQQRLSQGPSKTASPRPPVQQQPKARHHKADTKKAVQQQAQQQQASSYKQQQQQRRRQPRLDVFFGSGSNQDWSLPTGLAVTWLGTSSGAPSRDRNISCTMVRMHGALYPVDCGEGSHRQAHLTGLQLEQVDTIFITHLHGDHCFGIGGMLISINKARKAQQQQQQQQQQEQQGSQISSQSQQLPGSEQGPDGLRLVGPPKLGALVAAMLSGAGVARRLDLPVYVTEMVEKDSDAHDWQPLPGVHPGTAYLRRLAPQPRFRQAEWPADLKARLQRCGMDEQQQQLHSYGTFNGRKRIQFEAKCGLSWIIQCQHASVTAAQLQHRVPCWGYVFDELPETSQTQQQQQQTHTQTQTQEQAKVPDTSSTSSTTHTNGEGQEKRQQEGREQELPRRRVLILGDTMDSRAIAPFAIGADLVSHEATFARGMESKAVMAQHSTAYMAGQFAWAIQAKALILTHFSARYEGSLLEAKGHGRLVMGGMRSSHKAPKQQQVESGDETDQAGKGDASDAQAVYALQCEAEEFFNRGPVLLARDLFTAHVQPRRRG